MDKFLLIIAVIMAAFCFFYVFQIYGKRIEGGAYMGPSVKPRPPNPELDKMIEQYRDVESRNITQYSYQSDKYLPAIQADLHEYFKKESHH